MQLVIPFMNLLTAAIELLVDLKGIKMTADLLEMIRAQLGEHLPCFVDFINHLYLLFVTLSSQL